MCVCVCVCVNAEAEAFFFHLETNCRAQLWRFSNVWYDSVRHGSLWHGSVRVSTAV